MMEWEKQNLHRNSHSHSHHQPPPPPSENRQNGNGSSCGAGMVYVKVMTDEQLETLRKQIAIYASICEQLVEMHKTLTTHQDLAGVRLGNLYCDPLLTSAGHKITARQRWTPTPVQLQILERIFDQGNGTPSKQKIKELTSELSQHGQISETNVYNWFQNRRARSKRKQVVTAPNNADSEAETEVDSPKDKKTKPESFQSQQNPSQRGEDMCFQSPQISSELHFLDPQTNKVEIRGLGQMSFFDGVLSNPRNELLTGKMEVQESYDLFEQAQDYNMPG